jgi:threonyl-tRNA synthetase
MNSKKSAKGGVAKNDVTKSDVADCDKCCAGQLAPEDRLYAMRHSAAHILAQAVMEMFPEAKLGIGPAIDHGFYYDFELPRTLIPEDLPIIEKKMKQIVKQNQKFVRRVEDGKEAIKFLKKTKQNFKAEMAAEFVEGGEEISFYENVMQDGTPKFVDLCEGPHLETTGEMGPFKLMKIAGAYWRGDEKNPMLQRIYGVCFEDREGLDAHLKMLKEAAKRDHRKLGKELEIYMTHDEVGAGLPMWLPNGAVIAEEIEKLAKEVEYDAGYDRVRTPHITKGKLYEKSGHLPYYADSMFPPMQMENEDYYLKPMNCPHHHLIYGNKTRSYRDLPVRFAEYGHCYRFEDSGALFGLMRVRSMCMNDAHIYCSLEQFEEEFMAVIDIYKKYFEIFGVDKYVMRLSLHSEDGLGKKYVDEPKLWIKTEKMVREVMTKSGVDFVEAENEAAFYGPKIDVEIWSAIGREFTLATNQLDFAVPKRFGLTYVDKDGKEQTPLCIHRAPLSTHERFIGFLIEHFAGAFPTWLAPVQVRLLPVSEKFVDYADEVRAELRKLGVRVELDDSNESLGKKIRNAEKSKIPWMLVIGEKEVTDKAVAARNYHTKEQTVMALSEFLELVQAEIADRKLPPKKPEAEKKN